MNSLLSKIKKAGSVKIIRNFSDLIFGNVVYQIFNLASLVYIARKLKSEGFGEFSFLLIQGQLFATIASLGIKSILIRNVARNPKSTNTFFWASILLQSLGFIFAIILLALYGLIISPYSGLTFIVLSVNILSLNFWDISEGVYMAHQKMLYPGLLKSITLAIWIGFLLVLNNKLFTYQTMFISYTVVLFINIIIAYLALKKANFLSDPIEGFREKTKSIFNQSFPYFLLLVVSLPINFLSNNFLKINSTNIQLGYFNTSNRLTQPMKLVSALALLSFFPNVSVLWNNNRDKFKQKIIELTPLFISILLLISAFFSFFSKEMILIVFGKGYLPAIPIFKYQVWFVFFFTVQGLVGTLWMASDRQRLLSMCGIINAVICTPVLWIGSKYAAIGEAKAYFLVYLIITPILFIVFFSSLKLNFSVLIKPTLISILTISVCFSIPDDSLAIRCALFILFLLIGFYFNYNSFGNFLKVRETERT